MKFRQMGHSQYGVAATTSALRLKSDEYHLEYGSRLHAPTAYFGLLVTLSGIRPHAGASYRAPKDKEWQHAQRRYSAAGDWHSATLAAG